MITIIGAGHSGLYLGKLLSKRDFQVDIYDQKPTIGYPVHCTGIVTSSIQEMERLPTKTILNKLNQVEVNSPNESANFKLKNPDLVLDRPGFENWLKDEAIQNGAKIHLERKFVSSRNGEIVLFNNRNRKLQSVRSDFVIGADGPLSTVYKELNSERRRYFKGVQVRAKGNFESGVFKVHLGSFAPGFFGWVVPENEEVARIGLASPLDQRLDIKGFLDRIGVNQKKIMEYQGGLIPIYNPRIRTQMGNRVIIGDAALQTKATTGGGIVQGMVAARCAVDHLNGKMPYERGWRRIMGKELGLHLLIRKYLNKLGDKEYDEFIRIVNTGSIRDIIYSSSRDRASEFAFRLAISQPRLLTTGIKNLFLKRKINI